MSDYVELQVTSNYSFLRRASRIEELLLQAKALGMQAIAITDRNTVAGIARAHARSIEADIVRWLAAGLIPWMACPCWSTPWIEAVGAVCAAC
ncbi:PHP domain-containing protein [Acidisphaera sp. L21]|uniref:PHP domain-containing protein n=1 Tax=Acidisphaera sp. L21 TaxID=1641851 RepID=UPI0020B12E4C|nr:PHP domain-containing protein [Acidisphaera sp. L21]